MKLSLSMITLNCADQIRACLYSFKDHVDEVVVADGGSTDGTKEAILEVCPDAKIVDYVDPNRHPEKGWTSDFSAQRNLCMEHCSGDVIVWLDADDVVVEPEAFRASIEHYFFSLENPADGMIVLYDYQRDESGHSTVALPRIRVMRRGYFEWENPVHEDPKPIRKARMADMAAEDFHIRHVKPDAGGKGSAERNLWILEGHQSRGGKMNDRLWQNVATSLAMLGRHAEAVEAFATAIEKGGSNPETDYITRIRAGESYRSLGRLHEARAEFGAAQAIAPDRKLPYLALAEVAMDAGQAPQALVYCDLADKVGGDSKGFVWNPTTEAIVPLFIRARAFTALDEHERALACYEKLAPQFPGEESIEGPYKLLRELVGNHRLYRGLMDVHEALDGSEDRQEALLKLAPESLHAFPEVARANRPARPDDRPTVAIFCGPSRRPWGCNSVLDGVGGSEEAVIFLSRQLVLNNWHVEVYGFPPTAEFGPDPHGVVWMPYYAWDENDLPDVYVSWRQYRGDERALSIPRYLWLHDAIQPEWFSEAFCDQWTGIFCLTRHHASAMPDHGRGKVILTQNGIDADFLVDGKNRPHSFIYASSPDRGLEPLLTVWPKIREAIPDAELDLYYGFTNNYLTDMQTFPELRRLKESIEGKIDQPGIFWHGMVGQMELSHAFAKSGFWLYPTAWPETSCITAMKAQAMGCVPITSRYQASGVPETCQYDLGPLARDGMIYDDAEWLAEWTASAIEAAGSDQTALRAEMKAWARTEFSWKKVAAQWSRLFSAALRLDSTLLSRSA